MKRSSKFLLQGRSYMASTVFVVAATWATPCWAQFMTLGWGPQAETVSTEEGRISRQSLSAFVGQLEFRTLRNTYVNLASSAQNDIASFTNVNFSVEGMVKYYLSGSPLSTYASFDKGLISGLRSSAYSVGIGSFQRFLNTQALGSVTVGGMKLQTSYMYNLNLNNFMMIDVQYLLGGVGREPSYQSTEFVISYGIRL